MIKYKHKRPILIRRSQSIIEYTALIVIIVGALIAFSVYLKRASQGRMRDAADTYGGMMQYEK